MATPRDSGSFHPPRDADTDNIDLTPLSESSGTTVFDPQRLGAEREPVAAEVEAGIILIAHPENQRLGSRFRLSPGSTLEIGRSAAAGISLPEVLSISRTHARLRYFGPRVTIDDLGSTNGTFVNGRRITGQTTLKSGDRFQTAAVHFKLLHERDPEHAYHEAIYDLVMRDGLTEIYNKRKYDEELQREFARAIRHRRPLALVAFDLDDFKQVNDTYGHLCGDFVLKQLATIVRDVIRPEQIFARIGGDEFVILAPETALEGAAALARKLCERIAATEFRYEDYSIAVSCSFGVADLDPTFRLPKELYDAADGALFESKRGGRGRVTIVSPGAGESPTDEV